MLNLLTKNWKYAKSGRTRITFLIIGIILLQINTIYASVEQEGLKYYEEGTNAYFKQDYTLAYDELYQAVKLLNKARPTPCRNFILAKACLFLARSKFALNHDSKKEIAFWFRKALRWYPELELDPQSYSSKLMDIFKKVKKEVRTLEKIRGFEVEGVTHYHYGLGQGGDVDGDGEMDLVFVEGKGNRLIVSDDKGKKIKFNIKLPSNHMRLNLLADVDGDGRDEIIFSETRGSELGLYFYKLSKNGQLKKPITIISPRGIIRNGRSDDTQITCKAVTDLDGDGHKEIIALIGPKDHVGRPKGISVFDYQSRKEAVFIDKVIKIDDWVVDLKVADLNNDGEKEIIIAKNNGKKGAIIVLDMLGNELDRFKHDSPIVGFDINMRKNQVIFGDTKGRLYWLKLNKGLNLVDKNHMIRKGFKVAPLGCEDVNDDGQNEIFVLTWQETVENYNALKLYQIDSSPFSLEEIPNAKRYSIPKQDGRNCVSKLPPVKLVFLGPLANKRKFLLLQNNIDVYGIKQR